MQEQLIDLLLTGTIDTLLMVVYLPLLPFDRFTFGRDFGQYI